MFHELSRAIDAERERQSREVCLIASENKASSEVLECMSTVLNNKYAEGYPSKRYYAGCENIDKVEQLAIDYAKFVFDCKFANVQPHSGASANLAVYFALAKPGDTILGMSLDAGGHLTHGHPKVTISGKWFNSVQYGLTDEGIINYDQIKEMLYKHHPRVLVVGASAYPRLIDYKRIRDIMDQYNKDYHDEIMLGKDSIFGTEELFEEKKCYLMVDMAHVAGMVAVGLHPTPIPYADVTTTTTHKTLRGPRGGMILCNDEKIAKLIDKAVFPGCQGGPLEHVIAGKAQCLYEASKLEFRQYIEEVLLNCQAMAEVFDERGIKMVTGGTDNHLILIDLSEENITGAELEKELEEKYNIIVNKNKIWNDKRSAKETSGIRIGTAFMTAVGYDRHAFKNVAETIAQTIIEKRTP